MSRPESRTPSRGNVRASLVNARRNLAEIAEELIAFRGNRAYYVEAMSHVNHALISLEQASFAMRPRSKGKSREKGREEVVGDKSK